jgi:hypothetical protein
VISVGLQQNPWKSWSTGVNHTAYITFDIT